MHIGIDIADATNYIEITYNDYAVDTKRESIKKTDISRIQESQDGDFTQIILSDGERISFKPSEVKSVCTVSDGITSANIYTEIKAIL